MFRPVIKIHQDHSNCALFGAISLNGKPLPGSLAVEGIREAEAARGGNGSGMLFADSSRPSRGKTITIWVREERFVEEIQSLLSKEGITIDQFTPAISPSSPKHSSQNGSAIYTGVVEAEYLPLLFAVVATNSALSLDDARIISFAHGFSIFKGLETITELDAKYNLSPMESIAVLAHSRYATGSKPKAVRGHPFSFGNVAIVHNGDVTSYRANLSACEARLAELYYYYKKIEPTDFLLKLRESWVGNDSEVISAMIYTMLKTGLVSEPGLSVTDIMSALVPPFDNHLTRLLRGSPERTHLERLAIDYKGFGLDGPVSSIALINYEDEVQLLAFRDRNTFRPLQIVIDHESGRVFVASELRQIIAATGIDIFSSQIESYSPEPGKFLLVSSKSGIRFTGRNRRPFIQAPDLSRKTITGTISGEPSQFAGDRFDDGEPKEHRVYVGTLGMFGASYQSSGAGTLEIVGSVQDSCSEAACTDRVIVHANASMLVGNAFQGRQYFVRGSVDGRGFQQLRPKNGREPVAIVGETAGQYFGKMMSGGIPLVLGLEHLGQEDVSTPIVGDFVGTGMVGGRIFIRGHVIDESIGRPPQRRSVISVCSQLKEEGIISHAALGEIRHNPLDLSRVLGIIGASNTNQHLNEVQRKTEAEKLAEAQRRLSPLFDSKLKVERRGLTPAERDELSPHLSDYFAVFNLPSEGLIRVLDSYFTIVAVVPPEAA